MKYQKLYRIVGFGLIIVGAYSVFNVNDILLGKQINLNYERVEQLTNILILIVGGMFIERSRHLDIK